MRYRIISSDAGQTVLGLSMPERAFIITFLVIASALCLLTGLVFAVGGSGPGEALRALTFTGFGLFCLCAIFLFSTQFAPPRRMVFDNRAGRLTLLDRRGKADGEVPYSGISGFSVRTSMSQRIVTHTAGIDLARGGRLELYSARNERNAASFRDSLQRGVPLSAPQPPRPVPCAALLTEVSPGVLAFEWRRKTRPVSVVVSLLAVLAFFAAAAGSGPFASGVGAWIVAIVFGAFFVLVAAGAILRSIGERMSIRIEKGSLRFQRRSLLSRGRSFSLPLPQIAAVDFSMRLARVATRITFLRADEVERFVSYRQGTFPPAEAFSMLGFIRSLPSVDVSALPAARRFALAEEIREKLLPPG